MTAPEPDAYERVTEVFAGAAERAVEYADVWRSAMQRNAAGAYKAEDLLVDMQTVWGMSVRDAARTGAAVIEAMAPLVPAEPSAAEPGGKAGAGPPEA
ncbi:MAG: hypothetical protein Q8K58_04030 [Acidimicrobiales bacterium]|nr:hypothetical protein [Acidimicrobiales bacterium]